MGPTNASKTEEKEMPVSFEKDIKPMFRPIDIEHMKRYKVPLDDYAYMSDSANDHGHANSVEETLKNKSMPPGGPYWDEKQLDLYSKWKSDGYQP
jgi:hypothetical protein